MAGRGCAPSGAVPVRLELYLGLEEGLLAETGGEDLEQRGLELLGSERARDGEDAVEDLVEEDIDGVQRLRLELDWTDVGEDDLGGAGGDVGRTLYRHGVRWQG